MEFLRDLLLGERQHKYEAVSGAKVRQAGFALPRQAVVAIVTSLVTVAAVVAILVAFLFSPREEGCDSVNAGYQCSPEISHYWGQYSPYFTVPTNISAGFPDQCRPVFAQLLSRHGARDPTASKTLAYNATINKIHSKVTKYGPGYSFIKDYVYTLGADELTLFGEKQLVNSGIKFFNRYRELAREAVPFVRASGQHRVIESAQNWTQGFHYAKMTSGWSWTRLNDPTYPYPVLIIPEQSGENNTLSHDLCTSFENGSYSRIASEAQKKWQSIFLPSIKARLNQNLPGADLSDAEAINMMDLCPYHTVANDNGTISPFCSLLTTSEWQEYDYYETIGKFYGYSYGNPLGPTQGVGWVNELIARLTDQHVQDETSTNHTLDNSTELFPLGRKLYADFGHDNDMTAAISALGLYNGTFLPTDRIVKAEQANGFSAAWTVPFAARIYIEKLQCGWKDNELVRVLVNDRVVPLPQCNSDVYGRCSLEAFIESLAFAKQNGDWSKCFT